MSSSRRRAIGALVVLIIIVFAGVVSAGALLAPSPELVLATPTVSCSPSATVNLSWTDTAAGYYRPLWKHASDANWTGQHCE